MDMTGDFESLNRGSIPRLSIFPFSLFSFLPFCLFPFSLPGEGFPSSFPPPLPSPPLLLSSLTPWDSPVGGLPSLTPSPEFASSPEREQAPP